MNVLHKCLCFKLDEERGSFYKIFIDGWMAENKNAAWLPNKIKY